MTKKSPLEFYDEELSRTIRQIQQGLLDVEWPSAPTTTTHVDNNKDSGETATMATSQEDTLDTVDKLLTCSGVFVQQMELVVQGMPRRQPETKQWKEIVEFRKATLSVLVAERANVKLFRFPTLDESGGGTSITH